MSTIFLRFPDEATFNSLMPHEAFKCRQCSGSGQVITLRAQGYYETVPDPEDPEFTAQQWIETAPAEYGPCPKCTGTGYQDRIEGETGSPLPEGIAAISIIGPMYQGDPPTLVAGWHVNVLGTLPEAWKPYQITPSTPSRVFG